MRIYRMDVSYSCLKKITEAHFQKRTTLRLCSVQLSMCNNASLTCVKGFPLIDPLLSITGMNRHTSPEYVGHVTSARRRPTGNFSPDGETTCVSEQFQTGPSMAKAFAAVGDSASVEASGSTCCLTCICFCERKKCIWSRDTDRGGGRWIIESISLDHKFLPEHLNHPSDGDIARCFCNIPIAVGCPDVGTAKRTAKSS